MLEALKKFALRGNVVDLAIGFTVGAAFTSIARSLVDDLIMPPLGLLLGNVDFKDLFWVLRPAGESFATLADAQEAGAVTLNYGLFLNSVVTFALITLAMFFVVRSINRIDESLEKRFGDSPPDEGEPKQKKCRYCLSTIPYRATRCPQCTSDLADDRSPAGNEAVAEPGTGTVPA